MTRFSTLVRFAGCALKSPVWTLRADLSAFGRERRGVAAIEFAMIFPMMVVLFLGAVEFSEGLMIDRRVTQIASSTADIVAQYEQLTPTNVDDVIAIGRELLGGEDAAPLRVLIISVSTDVNGNATVDWARDEAGNNGGLNPGDPYTSLPDGLLGSLSSVIVSKVHYNYVPPISHYIHNGIDLSETFYLRPRRSLKVALVNN